MKALLAAGIALWCAIAAAAGAAPATVIVISLDGVRHDYLDRASFPALARIARDGLRAGRLVPVYPASTFPGHVSLATGTTPDVHGIVDNEFWDSARRERFDYANDASWIEAEPLWAAAERQGVPAATYFWVGSETDWRGVGARYRVAPFDAKVREAAKVKQILAWLDLPEPERPRLVMSWWHGADRAGHARGPDHPTVTAELAEQDEQLGALLAGLDARGAWPHTTLVVVSDHGMTTAEHSVPIGRALRDAGVRVKQLETGTAVAHVFLEDAADLARAERALGRLAGVIVARRDALPDALHLRHATRTGDLVVRAQPPYTFARVRGPLGGTRGVHGYEPERPEMAGILLALGRGVRAGARPDAVRMIDVAPTVARLLGIEPPRQSRGAPIEAIGVETSAEPSATHQLAADLHQPAGHRRQGVPADAVAPASIQEDASATFAARMRPCYPDTEAHTLRRMRLRPSHRAVDHEGPGSF